jgi:hypothetical protein
MNKRKQQTVLYFLSYCYVADLPNLYCSILPARKQMPTYNKTELAMTSQISKPVGVTNIGMAINPRTIQSN